MSPAEVVDAQAAFVAWRDGSRMQSVLPPVALDDGSVLYLPEPGPATGSLLDHDLVLVVPPASPSNWWCDLGGDVLAIESVPIGLLCWVDRPTRDVRWVVARGEA